MALSSQRALPLFQPPRLMTRLVHLDPLRHRPQLSAASLLTCVALLFLPLLPTPICSVSPRCPATLLSCYRPAFHVEPICIAPCRTLGDVPRALGPLLVLRPVDEPLPSTPANKYQLYFVNASSSSFHVTLHERSLSWQAGPFCSGKEH